MCPLGYVYLHVSYVVTLLVNVCQADVKKVSNVDLIWITPTIINFSKILVTIQICLSRKFSFEKKISSANRCPFFIDSFGTSLRTGTCGGIASPWGCACYVTLSRDLVHLARRLFFLPCALDLSIWETPSPPTAAASVLNILPWPIHHQTDWHQLDGITLDIKASRWEQGVNHWVAYCCHWRL